MPEALKPPRLDHDGKPYSPAKLLALEPMELTRLRRMRDSMILAERREELIETEVVIRQAAAMFVAVRQKLLSIPANLSRRLVGKDHRTIHDALTKEIHRALREWADFDQKVVKPNWQPESSEDPFRQTTRPLPKAKAVPRSKQSKNG
jgi:phage terminase Nu1 subunit (DNA packaging protein)